MEQREFDATQRINEECYQLIKAGYSMHDVHSALTNVMNAMGFNHPEQLSTEPLVISFDIDTTMVDRKLAHSTKLARDLHHELDN
ncbi:hypothetical protein [Lactiplantibacillus plantarum]|uniref:hypothetical protein n=1 Tax=Lactiplantibacillus plantarum TaxID=1590 RepID=UPI000976BC39|nr:hypothetical protein [Lactiplantibacillus plantarum]